MIDEITISRVDDGKDLSGTYYSTTAPANPEEGNIWYVLGEEDNIDSILNIKRYHNNAWETLPLTDAVFRYIHAGKLTVGTIQGPGSTSWNLETGEWQSEGEITLNGRDVDPDGSDRHDYTYDVEMLTHIQDGQFTVSGEDQRAQMTATFVDEVVQGDSFLNGNAPYKNEKADINQNSHYRLSGAMTSFPRGAIKLKGRAVETYSGYGDKSEFDTFRYMRFSPTGNYGPDEIALGSYEDAEMVDGESMGLNRPNRNILLLNAGWKNVEDAIVFREQIRTYYDTDDSAYHFDFHTPRYYRPVWPYKPGDKTTITAGVYLAYYQGDTSSRQNLIAIVDLGRPISEDVTEVNVVSGRITVLTHATSGVVYNTNDAESTRIFPSTGTNGIAVTGVGFTASTGQVRISLRIAQNKSSSLTNYTVGSITIYDLKLTFT